MESLAIDMSGFGDLSNLSAEKLQELETVLSAILALPVARETFAQVIEGNPTRTPYSDDIKQSRSVWYETTVIGENTEPSEKAIQEYGEIRRAFAPQMLIIDLEVRISFLNRFALLKFTPCS